MNTYSPISGMIICQNDTGDYVAKPDYDVLIQTLAQERHSRETAEVEIAKMLVRVNGRSDESESCPFCTRISMDATSQQCPMCHLCEIESSLETARWRAEKAERELAEARKDIADITEVWGHQITDYLEARHAARETGENG